MSSKQELIFMSCSKTLSAALYLFDFGSNIWVAVEYYKLDYSANIDYHYKKFENLEVYLSNSGAFVAMVTLMLIGHIGIGLAFKLGLPREEHPLRSAYFLPLIQLCRFVSGMWDLFKLSRPSSEEWTLKPKSGNHHESPKVKTTSGHHDAYTEVKARWGDDEKYAKAEALYAIMSASMEGGPLFLLQAIVVYTIWWDSGGGFPSPLFLVSLIVSGFSAASNCGRAIMYNLKCDLKWGRLSNGHRLALGFAGGLFSTSALVLHCATLLAAQDFFLSFVWGWHQYWPIIFYYSATFLIPFFSFCIVLRHPYNGTSLPLKVLVRAIDIMIATYISLSFGPIYPLINDARRRRELNMHRFYHSLKVIVGLHLLLEIIFIIFLIIPKPFFKSAICFYQFWTTECHSDRSLSLIVEIVIVVTIGVAIVLEVLSIVAIVYLLVKARPIELEGKIEEQQGTQLQIVEESSMVLKSERV